MNLSRKLRDIAREDPRFTVEAYEFVFRALDFTMEELERRHLPNEEARHITGRELLTGIRGYAIQQFGYLARFVFDRWGVHSTDDFGEIVFNLVENDLLKKRPEDSREDFQSLYDFEEAFDGQALADLTWPKDG
jgi:uncharacterized repeat protein (TIGR04138 family)